MAKRELKTGGSLSPVVRFIDKPNSMFLGTLKRVNSSTYGILATFVIKECTAPIKKKEGENLVEIEVQPGDEVGVFASGQLADKLSLAEIGNEIEIQYHGKKLNEKTGREFNDFTVSVIE